MNKLVLLCSSEDMNLRSTICFWAHLWGKKSVAITKITGGIIEQGVKTTKFLRTGPQSVH